MRIPLFCLLAYNQFIHPCQSSCLRLQENVDEHCMPHSEGQAGSKERKHRIMQSETLRKRQVFEVPATIVTFLALAADTGGSFSLFEYRVAPQQGIPLHRHSDDEAFIVPSGVAPSAGSAIPLVSQRAGALSLLTRTYCFSEKNCINTSSFLEERRNHHVSPTPPPLAVVFFTFQARIEPV